MDAIGAGELVDHLLGDVAEDAVADVVQQRGRFYDIASSSLEAEARAEPPGDVAYADRVLEAGVQRAG